MVLCLTGPALAADSLSAAGEAGRSALDRYGTEETIRQNAALPLTSPAADLHTIDRAKSGRVHITSPSSHAFLEIVVQPSGTGDLTTVKAMQDLDFDGSYEYSHTLPFPVSGVCANGVLSCAPGTWNTCYPYKWTADSSGRLSHTLTGMDSLGGCYCINASCGSNLVWNNLPVILKDLGGGAAGAVQEKKQTYTITETLIDGPSIAYYGRDGAGGFTDGAGNSVSGQVTQTSYYSAPANLTGDAEAAGLSQAGDPQSYYSLMSAAFAGKGTATDFQTCSITRNIELTELSLEDVIISLGGTGAVSSCGLNCINVILGKIGDNYWSGWCTIYEENYSFYVQRPELIQSAVLKQAIWDDYIQVWMNSAKVYNGPNANFPPETAGACELSTSWNVNPNVDVSSYFQQEGQVDTKIRVSVSGNGEGYALIEVRVSDNLCETEDAVYDGCTALENDSQCQLVEEKVDEVFTYRNYNPTSLSPLPSVKTVTGTSCTFDLIRNWWTKKRTYHCRRQTSFTFDDLSRRTGSIDASVEGNPPASSTVSYIDKRIDPATGAWISEGGTIDLPETAAGAECQNICKTRKPVQDTQAAQSGTTAEYRTGSESWDFFYKTCGQDDDCPLEPGEEIIKPCQCLDEFAEATSALLTLDAAAKDIICSDGVRK